MIRFPGLLVLLFQVAMIHKVVFYNYETYYLRPTLPKKQTGLPSSSVITLYALLGGPGPIVTAEMTKL